MRQSDRALAEPRSCFPERSLARRLGGAIWILMLGLPLAGTLTTEHLDAARLAAMGALVAVVAGTYVGYCLLRDPLRAAFSPGRLALVSLAILGASAALVFIAGSEWDFAFVFALWPTLALDPTRRLALPGVIVLAVVVGLLGGISGGNLATVVLVLVGVGTAVAGITRLVEANVALERARREEARLAIAEERLRFARDLHELLGHSLSVIALKTEVAARLLAAQPARAAEELTEIERLTRRALQEVRDAVSGYRQPTLAGELASARQALGAAGIACIDGEVPNLPATLEAPLAWALREGVTNVIRHSGARTCQIAITTEDEWTALVVEDDGGALSSDPGAFPRPSAAGNGLADLAERLGMLGGRLWAARNPTGGFTLRASLPSSPAPSDATSSLVENASVTR